MSTSGYSSRAWGKVVGRLPDNQTNSDERRTTQQKKEAREQQSERGKTEKTPACRNITISETKYHQKVKNAAKTIQSARSQTSAAPLTSDGGQTAATGLLSK